MYENLFKADTMNYANECQPKDVHLSKTLKYMLDL